jgi:hypothetical protein
MKQPLEQAAAHLNSLSSPFGMDINIIKAGFADLVKRLEALEHEASEARAKSNAASH